jgi:hypothetical protein
MRPAIDVSIVPPERRPVVRLDGIVLGELTELYFECNPEDARPVRRLIVVRDGTMLAVGRGGEA